MIRRWIQRKLEERRERALARQRYLDEHPNECDGGHCDWWSHTYCRRHGGPYA